MLLYLPLTLALLSPSDAPLGGTAPEPVLARSAAPLASPGAGQQAPEALFPRSKESLKVVPGMTLAALVGEYARITGQTALYSEETSSFLDTSRVNFPNAIEAAPDRLQNIFEGIMVQSSFVLQVVSKEAPRVFAVQNLNTGNRTTLRSQTIYLPSEQAASMAGHPGVLFSTTVHLPHVDVRQLSNSLRTMITDANTQQLLPAGATQSMLIVGFGDSCANMVKILLEMDRKAAELAASKAAEQATVMERFDLRYASAESSVPLLAAMLGTDGEQGATLPEGARVVADPRTNSLLVRVRANQLEDFRRAIMLLDSESK